MIHPHSKPGVFPSWHVALAVAACGLTVWALVIVLVREVAW